MAKTREGRTSAAPGKGVHERIWDVVRQVPEGRVVTYGQVAAVVTTNPRIVGFAMAGCPDDVPWHRVVNARGEISARGAGDGASEQRRRLRREGIRLDRRGGLDLDEYGWLPG